MSIQSETRLSMDGKSTLMGPRKDSYIYDKCRFCVNIFKWLPVVFISAVLCWGYYAYVWQLCIETMPSVILKSICLLVFHFLFIMTFWSYGRTIFVAPEGVPKNFWFTVEEFEALEKETSEEGKSRIIAQIVANRQLPVMCRTYLGGFRTCEKCNLIKADRAHHCSVCGYCVLKMDHHCPWVNNCVSFSNYKYFVLFLGYAFTLCLFAASTSFYYFIKSWKNELPTWGKFHILFLFFVAIMFAISLVSLFGYHVYLILVNRSTLESFRSPIFRSGPDKAAFNLGKYENWCQVFGRSKSQWFFPVDSSQGNGINYDCRYNLNEEEGRHPLLGECDEESMVEKTASECGNSSGLLVFPTNTSDSGNPYAPNEKSTNNDLISI